MQKTLKLNSGQQLPAIGLGTWELDKAKVGEAIKCAIDVGYRHIDCARGYENQKEIGNALKSALESKNLRREDLFIVSKLWNTDHAKDRVEPACCETLKDLGLEYLDCYLMHWPIAFERQGQELFPKDEQGRMKVDKNVTIKETWQAMEALVDKGLVKSIGVCNFSVEQMDELLSYARIKPALNQVELHPYLIGVQKDLCKHHERLGIKVVSYSPLARGCKCDTDDVPINDKLIKDIAQSHHKTPGQILIRWNLDYGNAVIPKSQTPERIKENFDVFDFRLTEEEVRQITHLGDEKCQRMVNPEFLPGKKVFAEREQLAQK